ncbi:MAG: PD-(D/E)XK nuclease family protein [Bdellovibrionota bacterium]
MLKIFRSPQPVPLKELSKKIDFKNETLILSNLRSKREIQSLLLEKNGYHLDESVMRASDFWRLLLRRYHPQKRLISSDYARLLISSWLRQQNSKSNITSPIITENSTSTLYQMIIQLSSLFLREQNAIPLEEWFEAHPEIEKRLGPWFSVSQSLINLFEEKNLILLEMIPAFLMNDLNLEKKWDRPLWIDLGSELNLAEAEVFQALSRIQNIHVIEPAPSWKSKYEYLLSPYRYLNDQSATAEDWLTTDETASNKEKNLRKSCKLSSRLSEVKNATGLIRQWLDSGISAEQIVVLAPQIETYWPSLSSYFEVEGIPSQKNLVVKLISLPSILHWISTLKSKTRGLSHADLETSLYGIDEEIPFEFEKFNSIFKNIYSEQDLFRIDNLKSWFFKDINSNDLILRDRFVVLSLKLWKDDLTRPELEIILRELIANTSATDSFLFSDWISFIQKIATQKEKLIKEGSAKGVEVAQLMSGHDSTSSHRIFLGLVEEDFTSPSHHFFNLQDRLQLSKDLGFQIENPEQNFRSFQLDWLLESEAQESLLSLGLTHFDGQLLNPLSQWMTQREMDKKDSPLEVELPVKSRWDDLQKLSLDQVLKTERNLSENEISKLILRIKQDANDLPEAAVKGGSFRVSPSSLMSYLECPFIFKAERVYKLVSLPEVDLDVDPRPQGNLVHRLFEKILLRKNLDEWTDSQLESLVEEVKEEQGKYFFEKDFWTAQKKKFLILCRRFIDFEIRWRKDHPQNHDVGHEVQWRFAFDTQTQEFMRYQELDPARDTSRFIELSGKIDRIDEVSDKMKIVIDYKSSTHKVANFPNWLVKNQLQLIFYMWVLEKGYIEGHQGESIGAFYYIFKNFKRDTGFRLDSVSDEWIGKTKEKSYSSPQQKEDLFSGFETLLSQNLLLMSEGKFEPKPLDIKTCDECRWSLMCRAPHLN